MARNRGEWVWSPRRRKAAKLIAEGELTLEEVARECGVSDRTIYRWKNVPDFDAYVRELEDAIREDAKRYLGRQALRAAMRLAELSRTGKAADRVKLQATVEILNRCGVIAVQGIEVNEGQPIVAILPPVEHGKSNLDAA